MERGSRTFEAIKVSMIGAEAGLDRFTKDGHLQMPPVTRWRNNLTALSCHENLFFIASENVIAVYEPEFPFQTLRRTPSLLIKLDLCNPSAPGYLNQHRNESPHCINHLIVGELGSQEILLICTDSGNVEAYYTSSVMEAVRKVAEQRSSAPDTKRFIPSSADTSLRPFFCEWIKRSSWGLSIHKHSRMIAVSANTPNERQPSETEDVSAIIVVFAFSLTTTTPPLSLPEDERDRLYGNDSSVWLEWAPNGRQEGPPRNRNYKIVLAGWNGHEHNIPNISFVDRTEDHEGTWLLSTDVTGSMKLWQVWKGTCYRTWSFGHQEPSAHFLNHSWPGWNVAALDIACFRPCRNAEEFVGASRTPMYYDYHARGSSFNLTSTVRRQVPDSSEMHPEHPDAVSDRSQSNRDDIQSDFDPSDNELNENTNMIDPPDLTDPAEPADHIAASPSTDASQSSELEIETFEMFHEQVEYEVEVDNGEFQDSSEDEDDDDDENDDEGDISSVDNGTTLLAANMNWRQQQRLASKGAGPPLNQDHVPSFAMIHCSDSHVRMLAGPQARFPHVFCAHILKQILPEHVYIHAQGLEFLHMDRLNMLQTIRELGIILIATQAGRVAICSLNRRMDDLLGFRVDWIIPTKRQERRGLRPAFCTLIGVAISPVQGRYAEQDSSIPSIEDMDPSENLWCQDRVIDGVKTTFDPEVVVLGTSSTQKRPTGAAKQESKKRGRGDPEPLVAEPKTERRPWKKPHDIPPWIGAENSRRYRVMLTYSDLTVLTYEVWREVERGDKASDTI